MESRRIRKFLFTLHSWLGLHLFLVLGLIFLSGTLLVFVREIDTLASGVRQIEAPVEGPRASFGQMFDAMRAEDLTDRVLEIRRSGTTWMADQAMARNYQSVVWLDPGSGAVLGKTPRTDIRRILLDIHTTFLTDKGLAAKLVTLFSLPLLLFIVTGLISYRRFWKGYFRAPPRHLGARGWWGGAHRLAMLWTLPFLVVMGLSAFYYMLGEFRLTIGEAHHDPAPTAERAGLFPEGFDGAALDRAVEAAEAAIPGLRPELVIFPADAAQSLTIAGPGTAFLSGPTGRGVFVDPATFEVRGTFGAPDETPGNRLAQINQELHFGTWGGLASRILWLLFGAIGCFGMAAGAMTYAARLTPEARPGQGPLRRLWGAMSLLRWLLPLWVLGMIAAAMLRYVVM